jgi:hypothetical protein
MRSLQRARHLSPEAAALHHAHLSSGMRRRTYSSSLMTVGRTPTAAAGLRQAHRRRRTCHGPYRPACSTPRSTGGTARGPAQRLSPSARWPQAGGIAAAAEKQGARGFGRELEVRVEVEARKIARGLVAEIDGDDLASDLDLDHPHHAAEGARSVGRAVCAAIADHDHFESRRALPCSEAMRRGKGRSRLPHYGRE